MSLTKNRKEIKGGQACDHDAYIKCKPDITVARQTMIMITITIMIMTMITIMIFLRNPLS